jgi:hypothetical protein
VSYLTAQDIADELRVHLSTAYEWMRQMPHLELPGGIVRVAAQEFDVFALSRRGSLAALSGGAPRVYFVQPEVGGLIKIGCTLNIQKRLAQLRAHSAQPLRLLGALRGHRPLEMHLHERFAADRVHGEWFAPSPLLVKFVWNWLHVRAA